MAAKPAPSAVAKHAPPATPAKPAVRKASPPTRQERAAERRQAILAAALDEFSESGFAAARLDDVARRAGVAKGTIYLHCRDKESLFQAIVREMLLPLVGSMQALGAADLPMQALGARLVDLFLTEVYATRRRDVLRLIITEGRHFPPLAEFYYREVLSRMLAAMRALIARAAARGQAPAALVDFPQLVAAPALLAVMWSALFDRFEPLDTERMLRAHVELLFGSRRAP
jgi:AcrR family transcriptional regulator